MERRVIVIHCAFDEVAFFKIAFRSTGLWWWWDAVFVEALVKFWFYQEVLSKTKGIAIDSWTLIIPVSVKSVSDRVGLCDVFDVVGVRIDG